MPNATKTKTTTKERLNTLAERRNALLTALEQSATIQEDYTATAHELAQTIAEIVTYKTLLKLSDSPKDISQSGAVKCAEMLNDFPHDIRAYHNGDYTHRYSDAMDIFTEAYIAVWEIFEKHTQITLDTPVLTIERKNGTQKDYTVFQLACKSIREYVHGWSTRNDLKKIQYCIGYTDSGAQITSTKRPTDNLDGIEEKTVTAFFEKYGLTTQQQLIFALMVKGETTENISILLNMPLRTVQHNIRQGKAKFATASAYAEYITARNAEKVAKAKAEKNPMDSTYQYIHTQAKERTSTALENWRKAFHA